MRSRRGGREDTRKVNPEREDSKRELIEHLGLCASKAKIVHSVTISPCCSLELRFTGKESTLTFRSLHLHGADLKRHAPANAPFFLESLPLEQLNIIFASASTSKVHPKLSVF